VKGGFELPESKSNAGWRDLDHLYVGFAFDSTTMTTSGYARVVKLWTRGEPISAAKPVYEGRVTDVSAGAFRDQTPGFERDFVLCGVTFYSNELFLNRDGQRSPNREARRRRRRRLARMAADPTPHQLDRERAHVLGGRAAGLQARRVPRGRS
jgi:prolyl oligopeptidase